MEEDKHKPPYPAPDQAEPLARRMAASQGKARQLGFDQTQTAAERKVFMGDGWGNRKSLRQNPSLRATGRFNPEENESL